MDLLYNPSSGDIVHAQQCRDHNLMIHGVVPISRYRGLQSLVRADISIRYLNSLFGKQKALKMFHNREIQGKFGQNIGLQSLSYIVPASCNHCNEDGIKFRLSIILQRSLPDFKYLALS